MRCERVLLLHTEGNLVEDLVLFGTASGVAQKAYDDLVRPLAVCVIAPMHFDAEIALLDDLVVELLLIRRARGEQHLIRLVLCGEEDVLALLQ